MATKKNPFDGLFAQIEEQHSPTGGKTHAVLYTKEGNPSVVWQIGNTVQQWATDADQYFLYADILNNIVQTLGEGYALQKQDVFSRQQYHHAATPDMEFLSRSYFKYFEGREYTDTATYLIITQELPRSRFIPYDPKKWIEFHTKLDKVSDILTERGVWHRELRKMEINELLHRFMAFNFRNGPFEMTNIKANDDYLRFGGNVVKSFNLVDIDVVELPSYIKPYVTQNVNGYTIATDVLSFLSSVPGADCVVYNQIVQIPAQRPLLRKLTGKAKRHAGMPDPSNKIAYADITQVLDMVAKDSQLLVYTDFNILVGCPFEKVSEVSSYVDGKLYESGIFASKSAYNQLELFIDSFPGNAYSFNPDYDLFLTTVPPALCLFYKEHPKYSEQTPITTYYTDRQGLPVCIDITGKEGAVKWTDNSNFFCIGPSGSGKSFHMNSVVRQLIEQDTDVVMVDTGDSYEGICRYFKGTYITYSKEHPISMNPFKITEQEYKENFGEKKNFLKSLLFLIFKGNEAPTKIEDKIINQTLVEYYDEYFHPFNGFTPEDREKMRDKLMLEDKKNGEYQKYEEKLEEKYGDDYRIDELEARPQEAIGHDDADTKGKGQGNKAYANQANQADSVDALDFTDDEIEHHHKVERVVGKLHSVVADAAASEGEKEAANRQLMRLMPELIEGKYLARIDRKIDKIEKQRKKLHVSALGFNSYYEFALERIPQIMSQKKIDFAIDDFAAILEQFYKGGEQEATLNNDVDASLFGERFIVFEIDKIKDDPVLFPIVVLIIMDVFLQKMRLKKGRKALIIEEAWKAISSPTMAEYIKYLYKTVRKFHGIAGVVTQELNDVIDSPIVKEAIINNSDIKILLDQSKFKDRYGDISAILGLTDVQKQQIFTINALNNHDGRNYFKEVWICRGQYSDVYGVEEPPECYWAYTTERTEKEALKIYEAHYGDIQTAITKIEEDRKSKGVGKYLDFAVEVLKRNKVMSLWKN